MTTHRSDSAVQRRAEEVIRYQLAALVGKDLAPRVVTFDTGAPVQVDAVAADESVLGEIFARQGKLKGGQQKKVAIDTLKLITLGRSRPSAELILAFADKEAAAYALGKGWLAEALTTWRVRVVVIEIDDVFARRDPRRASPPGDAQCGRRGWRCRTELTAQASCSAALVRCGAIRSTWKH